MTQMLYVVKESCILTLLYKHQKKHGARQACPLKVLARVGFSLSIQPPVLKTIDAIGTHSKYYEQVKIESLPKLQKINSLQEIGF